MHQKIHHICCQSCFCMVLLDILQTSSWRRFLWMSGWTFPGCLGSCSTLSLCGSGTGIVWSMWLWTGYHTCVGQLGTTNTPEAWSCCAFCGTCGRMLKGRKTKNVSSVHETERINFDSLLVQCERHVMFKPHLIWKRTDQLWINFQCH